MRSIVIGAIIAVGLSLVTTVPTLSAPANVAAIGQAAAEMGVVNPGALLVQMARLARLLSALALLVTRGRT
jgi:hypothetical protein